MDKQWDLSFFFKRVIFFGFANFFLQFLELLDFASLAQNLRKAERESFVLEKQRAKPVQYAFRFFLVHQYFEKILISQPAHL